MPLPLLEWLAERGLADLTGVRQASSGSTRGSAASGPGAPLPLARSQYDVPSPADRDGRRRRQITTRCRCRRSCSAPPPTTRRLADGIVARGNDELAGYVAGAPDRLLGLGTRPAGLAGRGRRGPAAAWTSSGMAGHRDRQPRRRHAISTTRSTTSCGRCSPSGAPSSSCTPAACRTRTGRRDFYLPQLVGYPMETALAVARLVFGRVLERFDLTCAWRTAAAACRHCAAGSTWAGAARTVAHTTAVPPSEFTDGSTTTPRCSTRCCCAGSSRTSVPSTSCSAPTIRSSCGDLPRATPWPRSGWSESDNRAILWDNAAALLGLPVS